MSIVTEQMLIDVGAKQVWPPKRHGKKYGKDGELPEDKKLLVAILSTMFGEHFKEIGNQFVLNEVRASPVAATYYELTYESALKLKQLVEEAHERRMELFTKDAG